MSDEKFCTRRRMLALTGGTAMVGLAGCTGSSDGGDGSDGDSGGDATATATATATETETDSHDDDHSDEETETHSGDDEHHHDDTPTEPADAVTVDMISNDAGHHFDPHVARVNVGGTVTFVNKSGNHSTTAYHPDNDEPQLVPDDAASWDSGTLMEEGKEFTHTFETEGVYHYYCIPHEGLGMIGSVIVGEPEAHGQPALENVPESKSEDIRTKLEELNSTINEALGHGH